MNLKYSIKQKRWNWKSGLDSNKELFSEVENEAKEKLRELSSQIDDEH